MDKYTVGDFKNALDKDSRKLFEFVYKVYFPMVKKFISQNRGNADDAKDVFQEAIVAVIRNIEAHQIKDDTLFGRYLISVCRYIWLNMLRVHGSRTITGYDLTETYEIEEETLFSISESVEMGIFQRNFKKLDKPCQKLLKLFFNKVPLKDIAKKLGLKDEGYAKKRKHLCKERLIALIKDDPDYRIFMKDKNI